VLFVRRDGRSATFPQSTIRMITMSFTTAGVEWTPISAGLQIDLLAFLPFDLTAPTFRSMMPPLPNEETIAPFFFFSRAAPRAC